MERDPMETALCTDIVMDIVLSHLNAIDLFSCRLVSKFWNKAASSLLRRRSTMIKKIQNEDQLMELQKYMMESSDFPFAGLRFKQPWLLSSDRAMEFFRDYGSRFTRLCLDTDWEHKLYEMAPFIDRLPRLSILEVGREGSVPSLERLFKFVGHKDSKILKLPSLRTIRIAPNPEIDEDVLREVVEAASPLLQIECLDASPEMLELLKNVGKLRAISCIRFDEDVCGEVFELKMDRLPSSESPSLTKLHFSTAGCLSLDGLMELLLSSQHTLKELRLKEMGLCDYSWDKFPILVKLTTLSLTVEIGVDQNGQYLFKGRHGHKFPALKEFFFRIWYRGDENLSAVWSDGQFIVPSVARIDFHGYVSPDGMKQLAQAFPNVIEVELSYRNYSGEFKSSGKNPFEIWSVREFEHLEKLKIRSFVVKSPTEDYMNMDRFLTGIPVSICKKLRNQEELKLHLINCPCRGAFIEVIRDNPCVLQLENLKELIVKVQSEYKLKELPEDPPFMSMVSVWYALQMMPNLRAKFVYDCGSPPSLDEEENKVLEAAFKHVQEYVKLEPVYY